jgi:XTP/dITP diphosphohydrolase
VRALPEWEIELLGADDYPPETGETYYENARAKAEFGRALEPQLWLIGEDSGIEVAGLTAARACTRSLRRHDPSRGCSTSSTASVTAALVRLRSSVALDPDGGEHRGTGTLEGRIVDEQRGSEGFGYDPIFVPVGEDRTVAELGNDWKRSNSHRARAADCLKRVLETAN